MLGVNKWRTSGACQGLALRCFAALRAAARETPRHESPGRGGTLPDGLKLKLEMVDLYPDHVDERTKMALGGKSPEKGVGRGDRHQLSSWTVSPGGRTEPH
jgi:hypothetical protein